MKHVDLKQDPVNLIYEGLASQAEYDVRHFKSPVKRFRASEMANCSRQIAMRLAGYLPEPRPQFLGLVGAAGNMYHDFVRAVGRQHGMPIRGIEFKDGGKQDEGGVIVSRFDRKGVSFDISCRADGDIELELESGETVMAVLEIKSMNPRALYYMEKEFKVGGPLASFKYAQERKQHYTWQGNTTALLKKRDYVYLLLVDRGSAQIGLSTGGYPVPGTWDPTEAKRIGGAVWKVEPTDKTAIIDKATRITQIMQASKLPDPEYAPSSMQCKQCPFFYRCHGAEQRQANGLSPRYPVEGVIDL